MSSPDVLPQASPSGPKPRVALFATCLVDSLRPSIGFAAAKLIEASGCEVFVPPQTCCGQPAYNSGDRKTATAVARAMIEAFENFAFVVVPSGSCGGMIIRHYPALFADDPNWRARAEALADKTHELMAFLVRIRGMTSVSARYDGRIAYHDSCSGLRELGISAEPRQLLASVAGASLVPLADADVCCGFGGTFAVKYDEISDRIVTEKAQSAEASGADTLCAGDLGCLLNIAGKLSRKGSSIRVRHVAEILAGIADTPAIGEARASVADARAKPNEP